MMNQEIENHMLGVVRALMLGFLLAAVLLTPPPSFSSNLFEYPVSYRTGVGPAFVVTADLRRLGRRDMIVSNPNINNNVGGSTTISVFLNNGDGTYAPAVSYVVGNTPIGIAPGDFNGDGYPDLAVANAADNTIQILINQRNGTFVLGAKLAGSSNNPTGIVAAHFTTSGHLDLAVTNSNLINNVATNSTVSIFLGHGDGTFTPRVDYPVGANPVGIAVADFNLDGKQDLVVANSGSNTLSVLFGKGDGTIPAGEIHTIFLSGQQPFIVATGDFDNNGTPDIVVADQGQKTSGPGPRPGQGLEVLLGSGHGPFSTPLLINGGDRPQSVAVADFNSDHNQDLVVSTSNGFRVMFGDGKGNFQQPTFSYATGRVGFLTAADLSGDGKIGVAATSEHSDEVWTVFNSGDGTFPIARAYPVGNDTVALALADFNKDGTPDIVTANRNYNGLTGPTANLLLGNGDGSFRLGSGISTGVSAASVVADTFDLNNSSNPDIAIVNSQNCNNNVCTGSAGVSLVLGNGDGTFQNPVTANVNCGPFAIASGLFDAGNNPDLAISDYVCNGSLVATFLGNGDGTFQLPLTYGVLDAPPVAIAVADLDGQNGPDLAVASNLQFCNQCNGTNNVTVLLNNGSGAFTSSTSYNFAAGSNPSYVAAGVLRAGNKPDLVVTNAGDGTSPSVMTVLLNNGIGAFSAGGTFPIGVTPSWVALADVNGDGNLDAVVADAGQTSGQCNKNCPQGDVSVLLGNGDGTFQSAIIYTAVQRASSVVIADFNADGAPDLAVADQGEPGNVDIILNTRGTFIKLTSSPNPVTYGQNVTFTATVAPSVPTIAPAGTVKFNFGPTLSVSPVAIVNGQAALTINSGLLGASTHLVTATYSGDANFNPHDSRAVSQVVSQAPTATSLSSSVNPSSVGQSVTLTAAVSYAGSILPPTGSVGFFDNGVALLGSPVILSGTTAALVVSSFAPGMHSITANYSGDSNLITSTSATVNQQVNKSASNSTVTSSLNPSQVGNPVTFIATVTSPFGSIPTGNVIFYLDGAAQAPAVTLNNGTAMFQTAVLPQGQHSIYTIYGGDANHAGSTSFTITQIVNLATQATTITTLAVSVAPLAPGEPANTEYLRQKTTLVAHVTSLTAGTPGGPGVTFSDNGVVLGSGPVALDNTGHASLTIGFAVGAHSISAVYSGDTIFGGSLSNPQALQHSPRPF